VSSSPARCASYPPGPDAARRRTEAPVLVAPPRARRPHFGAAGTAEPALAACGMAGSGTVSGMPVQLGVFVVPSAEDPARTVAQVLAAEDVGLDMVGIQDHPYQRRFLDTWALLAFLAARTERLRLVPDVANLPLRPPAMMAKAAASIDLLSGGRFELGLGAGAFWEAIGAMGGPKRSRRQSVDALEEAIEVIRLVWAGEGAVDFDGRHYRLRGHKPGPRPAHRIGIWIGGYGPRMLRLTGRLADGWLPSLAYLPRDEVPDRQRAIDAAAAEAGRDPAEIRRVVNVGVGSDSAASVEQLMEIARELRFDTLVLSVDERDPLGFIRRLGEDIAPQVRRVLA
jgi:alkanesulfonate monooxygenase SsuD/methylene tetrahydromethanopterin reductase-like flavin-dependent oxidoreductase (luciferase family)